MESRNGNSAATVEMETGAGTMNRTGIATSPDLALDLIREAQRTPPSSKGDARLLAEYRASYIEEEALTGSKPVPAGPGQAADPFSAEDRIGSLMLDKLGERLAFERQGVRLYECLIGKVKLLGKDIGGPSVEELEHILQEEQKHFRFLQQAIVQAGGDPTVQTPCANVAGVLSQGIVQVVADPRTTVVQCLEAMLTAELADNDGWSMLQEVVAAVGAADLEGRIEEAIEHEMEHLITVRGWLSALVIGEGIGPGKAEKAGKAAPTAMPKPDSSMPKAAPAKVKPAAAAAKPKSPERKTAARPKAKSASRPRAAATSAKSKAKKPASRPAARKSGRK